MFTALTNNALGQVSIIETFISIHDETIARVEASARPTMKAVAVSSCVTNLYATLERFIESLISDYLDAIPEIAKYSELEEELKTDYRIGISHLLSRLEYERYRHLSHENIIKWYHDAIANSQPYRFVTEALTRHEQNFRLPVIINLFSRVQIKDLNGWLSHHPLVKALYDEETSLVDQLEAEMRNFIQLRNDASHGVMEDLEGSVNLHRYCQLVRTLLIVLSSFSHKSLILKQFKAGKVKKLGVVTEVFGKSGAFIVQLKKDSALKLGDRIHLIRSNTSFSEEIISLQVNDDPVELVVADRDEFEVGVKCRGEVTRGCEVFSS